MSIELGSTELRSTEQGTSVLLVGVLLRGRVGSFLDVPEFQGTQCAESWSFEKCEGCKVLNTTQTPPFVASLGRRTVSRIALIGSALLQGTRARSTAGRLRAARAGTAPRAGVRWSETSPGPCSPSAWRR